ncbi:MAG: hypothetical protein AMR96_02635 [Candidatus Adiutrix intracellularis]|nr:MAG: hypothetical protein AMR96_02635 [Candidatus Adiutrix intracellularis]
MGEALKIMTGANHNCQMKYDPTQRQFVVFLLVHFIFWMLISFTRDIPHYDSTEALTWGLTWEWGTNKHPPLSNWLVEAAFRVLGDPAWAVYLLGQICVMIAFIFIHRLALGFLAPEIALFCVLFLEGTIYYNFNTLEYNVNVLSLALVPVIIYLFKQALQTGRQLYWLAAGLSGGFALLTKYTNGLVLLALGFYLLLTSEGRARLKSFGPWLAVAVAGFLFLPHGLWLAQYDFLPLRYSQDKVSPISFHLLKNALEPLRLLGAQLGNAAVSLSLFAYLYFQTPAPLRGGWRWPDSFLAAAGVLPLLFLLGIVALTGINASTKWAYAFMGYFPLLLFIVFPVTPPLEIRRRAIILTYVVMLAFGLGCLIKNVGFTAATTNVNGRSFAVAMKTAWTSETTAPLLYVGGAIHLVSRASTYLPERPRPFFDMDPNVTVWEDEKKVLATGLLVLANTSDEYDSYQRRYPVLPKARHLAFPLRAPFGRPAVIDVYYGIIKPEGAPEK